RELVVRYKAEKVCHEEMVKMPLVQLKVIEDGSFRMCVDYRELSKIDLYSGCHQMKVHEDEIPKIAFKMRYGRYEFTAMPFWIDQCASDFHKCNESGGARVAFVEEREVSCEAQQGRSEVKRKLFGSYRNNIDEAIASHGVHVSSISDKDGMYIEVLERDMEVVRNINVEPLVKSEREFLKEGNCDNRVRAGLIARLIEEFGFACIKDAQEKPYENTPKDKNVQDSEDVADKEEQHQMSDAEQALQDELEKTVAQEVVAQAVDDATRQAFKEEKRKNASTKKAAQATSTNTLSTVRPFVSTANTNNISVASTPTEDD
ncbi:hypothetical protein Tco_1039791, partial [Tanacetum coccineum]